MTDPALKQPNIPGVPLDFSSPIINRSSYFTLFFPYHLHSTLTPRVTLLSPLFHFFTYLKISRKASRYYFFSTSPLPSASKPSRCPIIFLSREIPPCPNLFQVIFQHTWKTRVLW